MREGFFWTTANFEFTATYNQPLDLRKEPKELVEIGWTCNRNFLLSDWRTILIGRQRCPSTLAILLIWTTSSSMT
ncbi:hypothetical protein CKAH01_08551 [Colletotrichum kahawae]|uniref:Uncharacterized protein n=1 Tax=Colletotrichum kahawae TaxID=34407 RepID=A0AAD9Y177_COLKA|nr:hypothetical protein CKAH01_08551 [Colletotrichum kahawae]